MNMNGTDYFECERCPALCRSAPHLGRVAELRLPASFLSRAHPSKPEGCGLSFLASGSHRRSSVIDKASGRRTAPGAPPCAEFFYPIRRPRGGGGGIRTPGTFARSTVFKTAAFNHSATPPWPGVCFGQTGTNCNRAAEPHFCLNWTNY